MRAAALGILIAAFGGVSTLFASTLTGRATSANIKVFALAADESGQLLLTLHWKKKAARLALLLVCDDIPVGSSSGNQDRFHRLEVGLPPSSVCEVGVTALRGSSKFWLNVQYTGGLEGAVGASRWAVVAVEESRYPALATLLEQIRNRVPREP